MAAGNKTLFENRRKIMEKIQCTNCKAPLDWDGYEEMLTCPYCGTRFDMRGRIRSGSTASGMRSIEAGFTSI